MTKFEELTDIISRNKNKSAKKIFDDDKEEDDIELEVSGSESSSVPLVLQLTKRQTQTLLTCFTLNLGISLMTVLGHQPGTLIIE